MDAQMLTIVMGVVAFIGVVVGLTAGLMAARAKLVNSGEVTILINDDESAAIKVPAGDTLLNTLASHKIFIPSACGGGGTCGVCKVHVHDGGGSILPTEQTHVTRGEEREGAACPAK